MRRDITFLKNIDWKYITIDEGQKVKNANSHISKYAKYIVLIIDLLKKKILNYIKKNFFRCMRAFNCTNKLILTGTPIQNDMSELWSLLNWLMPKIFDQLEDFNSWFVIDKFFDSNDKIVNMAKKDELLDIILKVVNVILILKLNDDCLFNLFKILKK